MRLPSRPGQPASLLLVLCALGAAARGRGQQAPGPVSSPPAAEQPVVLSQFDVTSTRDVGYGARDAMGATRMAVDLDKTPTTVVVLDQEFLKDIAALDVNTATQYISGMNTASVPQAGQVAVRGFNQGGINFRDGLPQSTAPNSAQLTNPADIERIEVIKGPEGVLYGAQSNGGVINAVSKQPLATEQTDVRFMTGSWNMYRVDVDNTGPLVASKGILYRVITSYQGGDAQALGEKRIDKFFSLALAAPMGPGTTLKVKFSYAQPSYGASTNPWFANGSQLSTFLPVRNNFDETDEVIHQWQYLTTVALEHGFGDNWRLRLVFRDNQTDENKTGYNKSNYTFIDATGKTIGTVGAASSTIAFSNPNWVDIIANRTRKHDIFYQYDYGPYLDLTGNFKLGPTSHTTLFSLQYEDTITNAFENMASYPSTSVIHPVHYSDPLSVAGVAKANTSSESSKPNASAAVADNIGILDDKVILAGGIRQDSDASYGFNRLTNARTTMHTNARSYKGGAVYRPVKGVAAFYNYSDTFTPVAGTDYQGNLYKPEVGKTDEGGLKLDLLDGKIAGTVSYFKIKQTNVPESVVVNPATGQTGNVQAGFVQVKGEEMDLAMQPVTGVTMTCAYGNLNSVTDKGVTQRNVTIGGNFKTLVKYSFPKFTCLRGLSIGAGYIYTNRRAGDTTSSFYLPAYEVYNGFLIYQRGTWRFQVNGNNLKNSIFAGLSSVNNVYIYTGVPRTYQASVEYRF